MRAGDTVPYVICDDGTNTAATQRAYHVDEMKNSESLKIDTKYYLAHQIHPVVTRLCEPIEGTDAYQIANCLGLDTSSFKRPQQQRANKVGDNLKKKDVKFRNVLPFLFKCSACRSENKVSFSEFLFDTADAKLIAEQTYTQTAKMPSMFLNGRFMWYHVKK